MLPAEFFPQKERALKSPSKIVEDYIPFSFFFFFFFLQENNAWLFMWADNSYEMASLIFSKKIQN